MSALKTEASTVVWDISPEAQLMSTLGGLPEELQEHLRSHFRRIADELELACPVNVELTSHGFAAGYTRCFNERVALIAYAPDVRSTVAVSLCPLPWEELRALGERYVAQFQSRGIKPFRALLECVYASFQSTAIDLDLLHGIAAVVDPTKLDGRLPVAWALALAENAHAMIPVILPPTMQEIEAGTWEMSR
jgi:hypothetical protein